MKDKDTAEDIGLSAICGLYCGECPTHKGEIAGLAGGLRKKLNGANFDKLASAISPFLKEFQDYPQCIKVLGALENMSCEKGCRNGGANPGCKIRLCCKEKNYAGCWECAEFETCPKPQFLRHVHGEATLINIRKIRKSGMKAFLEGPKYW